MLRRFRARFRALRLGLMIVSCGLVSCARQGPLSDDPKVALRQLEKLVPRGMSEADATQVLRARGFTFSRLSTDNAPNHLVIASGFQGERVWQVGLIIVNAEVAASTVTVTDTSKR